MEQKKNKPRTNSLWTNIQRAISIYWNERKIILIVCGLAIIARVALPYLGILMPKVVLTQIAAQASPEQFLLTVGSMALLLVAVNFIKAFTDSVTNSAVGTIGIGLTLIEKYKKYMQMDYELMEAPEYKGIKDNAEKAAISNHAPAMNIPRTLVELLSNVFGLLLYAGVIAVIHPLILVALFFTASVNWLMLSRARKYLEATRNERSKQYKKLDTLSDTLREPGAAKDIRLYGAFDWLRSLYRVQFNTHHNAERKVLSKNMHALMVDALMILLRDGAAYAFLIWLVLEREMTLGDFVLIFAAIGGLSGWISGVLTAASDLSKACMEFGDIQAMLEYPDCMNNGSGVPLPMDEELPPSIELRGVGYTYPNEEKPALKNINLIIRAGERIAIVGANGAGKTTLIKLICGLYGPTEGTVLLNSNLINAYNRDEYYTLFSAVFQDIHMLPATIAENISQQTPERTDKEKVRHCLKLSGLFEKTESLPEKEDTLLVRTVHPDAIELSGGEKQKLVMSRALYKDAPIIILDEPTAALDPIAENEVYQKYAKLTEGKTSIYISHRLASTRFCDRILLIDGNVVAEQGSHDELMSLGGTYAGMFEIQASYYQKTKREVEKA